MATIVEIGIQFIIIYYSESVADAEHSAVKVACSA